MVLARRTASTIASRTEAAIAVHAATTASFRRPSDAGRVTDRTCRTRLTRLTGFLKSFSRRVERSGGVVREPVRVRLGPRVSHRRFVADPRVPPPAVAHASPGRRRDLVVRLSPRVSGLLAATLVVVGFLRFVTDTLHELDPDYWRGLEGSWLRYVVRAPSDGSFLGDLNAQCFKLLAIPSGIALIYLRNRLGPGTSRANEAEFHDWTVRGVWIAVFFVGFTVIELQKQFSFLSLNTRLVAGEDPWVNHLVHAGGAVLAWKLAGVLSMAERGHER